jgi:hypothetical protein
VLLLRACHDRNVVSFVGASVQSGHAVLVTVRKKKRRLFLES